MKRGLSLYSPPKASPAPSTFLLNTLIAPPPPRRVSRDWKDFFWRKKEMTRSSFGSTVDRGSCCRSKSIFGVGETFVTFLNTCPNMFPCQWLCLLSHALSLSFYNKLFARIQVLLSKAGKDIKVLPLPPPLSPYQTHTHTHTSTSCK